MELKEEVTAVGPGISAQQAQDSACPFNSPGGTDGAAGCPEHHAPEQVRGGGESGSDRPVLPSDRSSISEGCRPRSVREVTRWEHPPRALGGAIRTIAKSNTTAPAGRDANRPK
jgi:hypothetical protein